MALPAIILILIFNGPVLAAHGPAAQAADRCVFDAHKRVVYAADEYFSSHCVDALSTLADPALLPPAQTSSHRYRSRSVQSIDRKGDTIRSLSTDDTVSMAFYMSVNVNSDDASAEFCDANGPCSLRAAVAACNDRPLGSECYIDINTEILVVQSTITLGEGRSLFLSGHSAIVQGSRSHGFLASMNAITVHISDLQLDNFKDSIATISIASATSVFLSGLQFSGGVSFDDRTAVAVSFAGSTEIKDCIFRNLFLELAHNAVFIEAERNDVIRMTNCLFTNVNVFYFFDVQSVREAPVYLIQGTLTMDNCIFSDNDQRLAGALYMEGTIGAISNSRFTGNYALRTAGAIYCTLGCPDIIDSYFSDNVGGDAGAVYLTHHSDALRVTNTSFSNNMGERRGGAIAMHYETVTFLPFPDVYVSISDCAFDSNSAGFGGAVFVSSDHIDVTIRNSSFAQNRATDGGGIYFDSDSQLITLFALSFYSNGASARGGGVFVAENIDTIRVDGCVFQGNSATSSGGGVFLDRNAVKGHIYNSVFSDNNGRDGGAVFVGEESSFFTVSNCHFNDNYAVQNGGGLSVSYSDGFFLTNSVFSGNNADLEGGGVRFGFLNLETTVSACHFEYNFALINGGGGSFSQSNVLLSVQDTSFDGNFAVGFGGGIYIGLFHSDCALSNISISGSIADKGGGIAIVSNTFYLTIVNVLIESSVALSVGGALYLGNNNDGIAIRNAQCNLNSASLYGGGLFMDDRNLNITFQSTEFDANSAIFGGGGYINTNNEHIRFENTNFEWNDASVEGGGLYIDKLNSNIDVNALLSHNTADVGGGGVFIGLLNSNIWLTRCIMEFNRARDSGGALYMERENGAVFIHSGMFRHNSAGLHGGAIYLGISNDGLEVSGSAIHDNEAAEGSGGGMHVLSPTHLDQCTVKANVAGHSAGGCYMNARAHIIVKSLFNDNVAKIGSGGAIEMVNPSTILMSGCTFNGNTAAVNGGALSLSSQDEAEGGIEIADCYLESNLAGAAGGAIHMESTRYQYIDSCTFIKNIASSESFAQRRRLATATSHFGEGGGLSFNNVQVGLVHNSTFERQSTALNGGAIVVLASSNIEFTGNMLVSSTAQRGSGSALYILDSTDIAVMNNTISNNIAPFGGGAVFWESDGLIPATVRDSNSYFENIALFGPDYATSRANLSTVTRMSVHSYSEPLPSFGVHVIDFYGNIFNIDNTSLIVAEVSEDSRCSGRTGSVAGSMHITVSRGIALFDGLRASCFPGGILDIALVTTVGGVEFSVTTSILFRECRMGEYILDGACVECPLGSYSFDETGASACKPCPSNTEYCHGHTISVPPGYWRPDLYSSSVYECPYKEEACLGGPRASNDTCGVGYEGPLCAVCSDEYYFASGDNSCRACSASGLNTVGIAIIAVLALVLFIPLCYLGIQWAFSSTAETLVTDFSVDTIAFSAFVVVYTSFAAGSKETEEELEGIFNDLYARWWSQIKIALSLIQIVTALPVVTDVEFPPLFGNISNVLNKVNIDIPSSFGILCEADYDFIDVLMVTTLTPLAFWAGLWLVYGVHYVYSRLILKHSNASIISTYGTYLWVYLFTSYMVLPGVAVYIFGTFNCHDIDDEGSYLRADYSISCASDRYYFGTLWAAGMAFVYCLGVPMTYLSLLRKRKHTLIARGNPESCTKLDLLKITPLTFLFSAYEPQFWYWEVIETFRRLILTGVLVLVAQGSALQLIVGMGLAVFFIKLYAYYKPYDDDLVDTDAEVAQYQVFFAMFILLIIQNDLIKGGRPILDAAMVLNFFVLFLFPILRVVKSRSWYLNYAQLASEKEAGEKEAGTVGKNMNEDEGFMTANDGDRLASSRRHQRQADSDDESLHSVLGEGGIEFTDVDTSKSGHIPGATQRAARSKPPPAGMTYDSQFTKTGDQLTWTHTMLISIAPQRDVGVFSYVITTRFKDNDTIVETEKSYKSFVELNEVLHPFIVVVAFPRGMRQSFPDDRVSSWFFGENFGRSVQRAADLTEWMNELTASEKLMVVRDAHAALIDFLGIEKSAVTEPAAEALAVLPHNSSEIQV